MMEDFLAFINPYLGIVFIVIAVLFLVLLVQYVRLGGQIKQLKRKYAQMTRGVEGTNFDEMLTRVIVEVDSSSTILASQQEMMNSINQRLNASLNRISITHYNAFDFTYGELSFSMAVLDELGSGYIFTNIHNRDDARCYCKRIVSGDSKHPLSDEEKEVLEKCLNTAPTYSRAAK